MNSNKNSVLCVIPARLSSVRLHGKALRLIHGEPMIRWVYEQVIKTGFTTIVATDDEKILNTVTGFGGKGVMTAVTHESGSSRCEEAAAIYENLTGKKYDIVINVQGDEPLIESKQIKLLADSFKLGQHQITTLVYPEIDTQNNRLSENEAYAAVTKNGNALYFSRYVLPFNRSGKPIMRYRHVGIYAYSRDALKQFVSLPVSALEACEALEQNRWLENGGTIHVLETDQINLSVDTPEDLEIVINYLTEHPEKNIFSDIKN